MIGGRVQQVVDRSDYRFVEVLDVFDRVWRSVRPDADIAEGDRIWWQSFVGYVTREGHFVDRDIGECRPSDGPSVLAKEVRGE